MRCETIEAIVHLMAVVNASTRRQRELAHVIDVICGIPDSWYVRGDDIMMIRI